MFRTEAKSLVQRPSAPCLTPTSLAIRALPSPLPMAAAHLDAVTHVVELTGCDLNDAVKLLANHGGNIQRVVNTFYDARCPASPTHDVLEQRVADDAADDATVLDSPFMCDDPSGFNWAGNAIDEHIDDQYGLLGWGATDEDEHGDVAVALHSYASDDDAENLRHLLETCPEARQHMVDGWLADGCEEEAYEWPLLETAIYNCPRAARVLLEYARMHELHQHSVPPAPPSFLSLLCCSSHPSHLHTYTLGQAWLSHRHARDPRRGRRRRLQLPRHRIQLRALPHDAAALCSALRQRGGAQAPTPPRRLALPHQPVGRASLRVRRHHASQKRTTTLFYVSHIVHRWHTPHAALRGTCLHPHSHSLAEPRSVRV